MVTSTERARAAARPADGLSQKGHPRMVADWHCNPPNRAGSLRESPQTKSTPGWRKGGVGDRPPPAPFHPLPRGGGSVAPFRRLTSPFSFGS